MDEKILYYIWLSSTLYPGSNVPKLLLDHFGDIKKVYNAQKEDYEALQLQKPDIFALCNKNLDNSKRYYDYCVSNRIGILCYEDSYYPERLKIIDNPPAMFYYKGKLAMLDDYPCITMVGTRSCSERGFRFAYKTAYDAASKGAVIVNGLALGIDGACISGALDANGYAIGFLGCGIDRVYPYGNKDLFKRLEASGLIMTEFAPFSEPDKKHFPVRNRIMSAISIATAVFEAGDGSGARHTAMHAINQGRRIFAVPAKPYDKNYSVPLELIKDGATVFTDADDILTEYSMSFPHRINLANINELPESKLDSLVAKYFKKDTNPDEPVNRRFSRKEQAPVVNNSQTEVSVISEQDSRYKRNEHYADKETINKSVNKVGAVLNQKNMLDSLDENLSNESTATKLSVLTVLEKQVYDIIKQHNGITPDEMASLGIKIEDVLSTLTLLEIYCLVTAIPGGKYIAIK